MDLLTILKIVSVVLGALCTTIIPTVIALARAIKAKKAAKTEAETEAAKNDMLTHVNSLIDNAEEMYKQVDALMKANGIGSTGILKKENVLTKLQAYAIEKGYTFDLDFWSAKVDEIVKLTKKVNAR